MISQPENVLHELKEDYSGTEDLAAYWRNLSRRYYRYKNKIQEGKNNQRV